MDAQLLSILTIFGAALASTAATFFVSMYVNKRKLPVDIEGIKATTNLTGSEIIEKYQKIVTDQADENMEIRNQLHDKDKQHNAERLELMNEITKLRGEMLALDKVSEDKIEELSVQLVECRAELKKSTDYITRLVAQLCSWRIEPVPFEVEHSWDAGSKTGSISTPYKREGESKNG